MEVISLFDPSRFQLNEAWIVFKLNDAPISTKEDGDFNVLALMDAASCYILGTEFVPVHSKGPSELESKRLLKDGHSQKQQFPKALFMPTNLAADALQIEAERNGICVSQVPEEQLLVCIDEAREGFKEHVSRGATQ